MSNINYKEDSTKGKALILPKTYKGDVVVQVWIDSRVLATLSQWLDRNDNYTRFMSDVVKDSLGLLVETIVENGEELIDDTMRARNMLERKYRVNLNKGERGLRNVKHNTLLTQSKKSIRGIKTKYPQVSERTYVGSEEVSDEELQKLAKEAYEKHKRKKEENEELKRNEMEKARNSCLIVNEENRFDNVESSIPERDREIIAKENDLESQLEFMKGRVVKEEE